MAKTGSHTIDGWAFGRLIHNLATFLDGQLKEQEGRGLNPKGAIVHLRSGVFLLHWKELPDLRLEPLPTDAFERPSGLGPLLPAHPPNLDFSEYDLTTTPSFPFAIAYSISGGPLAGRAGHVKILSESEFVDSAIIIS